MGALEFTIDSLKDLDNGKAAEALRRHLRRAAADCEDRPGDSSPRKVQLSIAMVPVMDDQGNCDQVKLRIEASSTVPKHRTRVYSMGLRRGGMLVFNPDAPDNVNQSTFLNDDESED